MVYSGELASIRSVPARTTKKNNNNNKKKETSIVNSSHSMNIIAWNAARPAGNVPPPKLATFARIIYKYHCANLYYKVGLIERKEEIIVLYTTNS